MKPETVSVEYDERGLPHALYVNLLGKTGKVHSTAQDDNTLVILDKDADGKIIGIEVVFGVPKA